MKVKAAPGIRVPKQGAKRKYITDAATVEVDETVYYLRRLRDGDLIRCDEGAEVVAAQDATKAAAAVAAIAPVAAPAPVNAPAASALLAPTAAASTQA